MNVSISVFIPHAGVAYSVLIHASGTRDLRQQTVSISASRWVLLLFWVGGWDNTAAFCVKAFPFISFFFSSFHMRARRRWDPGGHVSHSGCCLVACVLIKALSVPFFSLSVKPSRRSPVGRWDEYASRCRAVRRDLTWHCHRRRSHH